MGKLVKVIVNIISCIAVLILVLTICKVQFLVPKVSVKVKTGELKQLTTNEKIEDVRYLYQILKDNFPYFAIEKKKTGYNWLAHKSEFEKWIKSTKDNSQYYETVSKILTLLQSGHTNLIVPDSYYNLYTKVYKDSFNTTWEDVITNKGSYEKYSKWACTAAIMENNILPFSSQYVEGKYVVLPYDYSGLCILKNNNIPKGSIITNINGVDIDTYIKLLIDKEYLHYDFKRKKLILKSGIIPVNENKKYNVTFCTPQNKIIEATVKSTTVKYGVNNVKSENDAVTYNCGIIRDGKVAYIKLYSFDSFRVDKDHNGIYSFLENIKDYPYLIIDIRGNGGGDTRYWENNIVSPLISKPCKANTYCVFRGDYIKPFIRIRFPLLLKNIKELPKGLKYPNNLKDFQSCTIGGNEVNPKGIIRFKGKIFLLVDDNVFSSSESFAVFSKSTGFAKLIGTTTGGDGIGIDPCIAALPNSGLIFRFPIDMGLNPDGRPNEEFHTTPDIFVEQTYKDYIKNINNNFRYVYDINNDTILQRTLDLTN